MSTISDELLSEIKHDLVGTMTSIFEILERYDLEDIISFDDLEDRLLDVNVEECQECEWWCDSCDLTENEYGKFVCDACLDDVT